MYKNIHKLNKITVYIDDYNHDLDILYIKNKLQKFFSPQVILFCEKSEEANVFITKDLAPNYSLNNVFHLENIFDDNSWIKLLIFLIERIVRE
ncbi:hypothetical protein [Lactococcus garvieae]|uniref:hypothetical protein n=1 Tax=Lactococcus garvieae TaxID=1363 RepID=UPI0038521979